MRSRATTLSAARVRRRVGAVARAARRGEAPPVVGVVDDVSPNELAGWLRLPQGSDPVLVELHVGGLVVTWTYTSPQQPDDRRARPRDRRRAARAWRDNRFHAPKRARQTAAGEIHTFSFRLQELWSYTRRNTRISVRVDGQPLPIAGHGMYLSPPVDGAHAPKDLRRLLESGYVLNQRGRLILSKALDPDWQQGVVRLYGRVRSVLAAEHGLDVFLIYGTLLGAVREGGPIRHDDDFDTAYISAYRQAPEVAAELARVALTLIHHGFVVKAVTTHLAVRDPGTLHKVDVGHLYFDDADAIAFPFGVAGSSMFTGADWEGLKAATFLEGEVLVPVAAESLLTHIYGDDWRRPRPGFRWSRSRTKAAPEARLTPLQRAEIYTVNFLRHHAHEAATLPQFLSAWPEVGRSVVAIGCGDGRDACALAAAGRRVLGLDVSVAGVERATAHASELGLGDAATFAVCDFEEDSTLRAHVKKFRAASTDPITLCTRYFVLADPDQVQDRLLLTLNEVASPGDILVVECCSVEDEWVKDAQGLPTRPSVDVQAMQRLLETRLNATVEHVGDGPGLLPGREADPVQYRVLARWR